MNKPITVIVPIYNVEKYIDKCISSLITQSYKNIDILLVDDGSTDNSGKICDKYQKEDNRINVVHKANCGYGSVLQLAIKYIKTKYFLICDPDDWLESDAIETLIITAEKTKSDLVVGAKHFVYSDGKITNDINNYKFIKPNYYYKNIIPFLALSCSPHSKLFKTSLCKDIKFPDKINNTDYILYHLYLSKINSAIFINKALSNYYIDRPGNSYCEDISLSEKSLKSNYLVTIETLNQINKSSKIYPYLIIHLSIRSIKYIILIKKYKKVNSEYLNGFNEVINNSSKYKKELLTYFKTEKISKIKIIIKYFLYRIIFNKHTRKIGIYILKIKEQVK